MDEFWIKSITQFRIYGPQGGVIDHIYCSPVFPYIAPLFAEEEE
jgi:hypothetical protein